MCADAELPIPQEPVELKEAYGRLREMSRRLGLRVRLESIVAWGGNALPSYLWRGWRDALVPAGFTWQDLVRVLRMHESDLLLWVNGYATWSEVVGRIARTIKSELARMPSR